MFKHYLLALVGVLAAVVAYLDSSGFLATLPLPERLAWLPIGVGVANIVIQQLRRAKVDKSSTGPVDAPVDDEYADDPY